MTSMMLRIAAVVTDVSPAYQRLARCISFWKRIENVAVEIIQYSVYSSVKIEIMRVYELLQYFMSAVSSVRC